MYVERLVLRFAASPHEEPALVEALVGSELFSHARVPLEALPKEDRAWLTKRDARAVTAWIGGPPPGGQAVLAHDGEAHVLVIDDVPQRAHRALDEAARTVVDAAIVDFLDVVQGCLVLAPDGRAIARRKGDAPV